MCPQRKQFAAAAFSPPPSLPERVKPKGHEVGASSCCCYCHPARHKICHVCLMLDTKVCPYVCLKCRLRRYYVRRRRSLNGVCSCFFFFHPGNSNVQKKNLVVVRTMAASSRLEQGRMRRGEQNKYVGTAALKTAK